MVKLEELIRQFKSAHSGSIERSQLKIEIKKALYREYADSDNFIRLSAYSEAFKNWRNLDLSNCSEREIALAVQELENLPKGTVTV